MLGTPPPPITLLNDAQQPYLIGFGASTVPMRSQRSPPTTPFGVGIVLSATLMRQTTLHKLNAKAVNSVGDGWHSDGGGLYLRVKGASRSWVFRWSEGAKKRERAIGPQSAISLATARLR